MVGAHATKSNIDNAHTSLSVSSTLAKPGHRSLLGDQSSTNLPPTARSSIIIMNAIASTSSKHHNGQQRQRATNQW